MTDLLSRAERAALAAAPAPPQGAFVDGGFRPAVSGETVGAMNPAAGAALGPVAACAAADADLAVEQAREAFVDGRGARRAPGARKDVPRRLAMLPERRAHECAVAERIDSGEPVQDRETVDIPETIHVLRRKVDTADRIDDQVAPVSDDHVAMVVREPIVPALAAGCTAAAKPADETSPTSLTAQTSAELACEAGPPAGVLNLVAGTGPAAGEPPGRRPGGDMGSFTGSTETGRRSRAASRRTCWNWGARPPAWRWTTPRSSTWSQPMRRAARSGTWARPARPPRA